MQEDGVDKVCSMWSFSGLERLLWSLARPHQYSGEDRAGWRRTALGNCKEQRPMTSPVPSLML